MLYKIVYQIKDAYGNLTKAKDTLSCSNAGLIWGKDSHNPLWSVNSS